MFILLFVRAQIILVFLVVCVVDNKCPYYPSLCVCVSLNFLLIIIIDVIFNYNSIIISFQLFTTLVMQNFIIYHSEDFVWLE